MGNGTKNISQGGAQTEYDNLGSGPNQGYNWMGYLTAAAPSLAIGVDALIQGNKAKTNAKRMQRHVDTLMQEYMSKPIENPYANLSVATQANQIKMEETDKALANTLDTLRAQGASAGGATALAQAALKSKAGIAADIERQEVTNEKLKAQGEIMVQNAEFSRMNVNMDYQQSKADQARGEQFAYQERAADSFGALGGLGLQAFRGVGDNKDKTNNTVDPPVDPPVDPTVDPTVDPVTYQSKVTNQQIKDAADAQRAYRQQQAKKSRTVVSQNFNPNNKPLGSGFNVGRASSGPRVPGAITLSQYYQGIGESLPSPVDRAPLYEQAGLGTAGDYTGSDVQNDALLEYLQNR